MALSTTIPASQAIAGANLNTTNYATNNAYASSFNNTGLTTSSEIIIAMTPTISMFDRVFVNITTTSNQLNIEFVASINSVDFATTRTFNPVTVSDTTGTITLANIYNNYGIKAYQRISGGNLYTVVTMIQQSALYNSATTQLFTVRSLGLTTFDATTGNNILQYVGQPIGNLTGVYASGSTTTINTPFSAFDAITASYLTTSLSAFTSALANTAIPITISEYTSLSGISSKCGALDTTMALPNGATVLSPAGLTFGFYTSYTTMGTGKTFFAFTTKFGNATTISQMKAGATDATLNNLHTNTIAIPATVQSYYVIKTPTVVSNSAGWNIASFNNAIVVFATTPPTGTYKYANGNVLAVTNPSLDAEARMQVLAR